MKTLLIKSTALVSLLGLAACGGGGGGGGSSTTTGGNVTEPVVSAPASTAAADLIAFVDEGGYAVANTHQNDSMTRMVRTGRNEAGQDLQVTVDKMANGTMASIQYAVDGELRVFSFDDTLVAVTAVPDGQYLGAFDVNFSSDGGASWMQGQGDFGMTVDAAAGEVLFGGMSTAYDGSDSASIEVYGDATLTGGTFNATNANTNVIYRENGTLTKSGYVGEVDGMFVQDGADLGAVGTVEFDDGNGLMGNGGFTGSPYTSQ